MREDAPASAGWDVDRAVPEAVTSVRRAVRRQLLAWGCEDLADDVASVVSELLANVVLHAPGPAHVLVRQEGPEVLLEVVDGGAAMPAPRVATDGGTTGRGLALVTRLATSWGVARRQDDAPGKVVWCRFQPRSGQPEPLAGFDDVEALLASFHDDLDSGHEVVVGEVPTELVAAAKDHLDGLLRELALEDSTARGALPREVTDGIVDAVSRFAVARSQLRREITRAQAEGQRRVLVRFTLTADVAEAGDGYLRALAQLDAFARDRRMLSLESPVAYRVLREWYVGALVTGLRRAAAGEPPLEPPSFEASLLHELQTQEDRARRAGLAAQLQQVTSRLAAADTLEDIAQIALAEGMSALGASGASLTRPEGRHAVAVLAVGTDAGMQARYDGAQRLTGPSADAIATGRPVLVSGRDERDATYPHLAAAQPDVLAVAAVPLPVVGEVVGALRFTWDAPRVFGDTERGYLEGLAAQTAQAVARSNALRQLREAEARSAALALLGERLAADRSVAGLAEAALEAVVPLLGDWAMVHLVDERGRIHLAHGVHRDPARSLTLNALFGRFEVTRDQPYGAGHVIATGTTQLLPEVSLEVLQAVAPGDEEFHRDVLASGVRTGVIVPLVARGSVVGALSVGRGAEPLGVDTVALLEDVGRRAGIALDNARALSTSVRLELALSAANVGSFEMRMADGRLEWDDRLFSMLEVDPETFEGTLDSFFAKVFPADAARTAAAIEAAVAAVGELSVEYRVQLRDGSVRWLEGRGRVLPGPDGTAERLVGVVVDVTAVRDQSAQARRSLELMADAFVQLDPDWVIVYANGQAERFLRQDRHRLLGSSIWDVFSEAVGTVFEEEYRRAVATGEPARFEARFGPLDATFEVRAFPSSEGLAVYFTDVSDRRATEAERDHALDRLQLLNDVGADLTSTLNVDEALTRLAHRMIPVLGDLVSVDLSAEDDLVRERGVVITAVEQAKADALRRAEERVPRRNNPGSAVNKVLRGEPFLRVVVAPDYLDRVALDADQLTTYESIDMRYALVVPLTARGRVFGALSLIRTGQLAVGYTDEEVELALEIGRRAGLMVDNTAQYDAQRRVAEGLQRSLLPELPTVPGLTLGAAYEPSSSAAKVGGDWYDAFPLPDGSLGLVIGDVTGHDIAAAAAMGQLRSVLRTLAADGDPAGTVVDRIDRLVTTFAMADLATLIYGRLTLRPDGSALLSWSNAGHPPPLLLVPGQPARFLDGGASSMIGVQLAQPREAAEAVLPPGSTLLMYTDGLVERRGVHLDVGLERIRAAAEQRAGTPPKPLCDQLVAAVRGEGGADDVALVALTLDSR